MLLLHTTACSLTAVSQPATYCSVAPIGVLRYPHKKVTRRHADITGCAPHTTKFVYDGQEHARRKLFFKPEKNCKRVHRYNIKSNVGNIFI